MLMLGTAPTAALLGGCLGVGIAASLCIAQRGSSSARLWHAKGGPAELPGGAQSHEML